MRPHTARFRSLEKPQGVLGSDIEAILLLGRGLNQLHERMADADQNFRLKDPRVQVAEYGSQP
jgi:hypothetical protein